MLKIQKLTKGKINLRLALVGPTGSGKTFTAMVMALEMAGPIGKVLFVDSERSSANRYADLFNREGRIDQIALEEFSPDTYVEALELGASEGYPVIVIDSLSHAWMGKEGALEQVDKIAKRGQSSGNSFNAWREVTPMHNRLVDALLSYPGHVIVTMRVKTEFVVETVNGKSVPRKVGLAPVQRDGVEYEFDIVADMDQENNLIVTKTRMAALGGKVIAKPGAKLAREIREWCEAGTDAPAEVVKDASFLDQKGKAPTAGQSDEATGYMRSCGFIKEWFQDLQHIARAAGIDERFVLLEGKRLGITAPFGVIRMIDPTYKVEPTLPDQYDPWSEDGGESPKAADASAANAGETTSDSGSATSATTSNASSESSISEASHAAAPSTTASTATATEQPSLTGSDPVDSPIGQYARHQPAIDAQKPSAAVAGGHDVPEGRSAFGYVPARWPAGALFVKKGNATQEKFFRGKAAERGFDEADSQDWLFRQVCEQLGVPEDQWASNAAYQLVGDFLHKATLAQIESAMNGWLDVRRIAIEETEGATA